MIFETIVITTDIAGNPHVTPFGVRYIDDLIVFSPFIPSITLDNVLLTECASISLTDDVRVFAGAITGKQAWQLKPTEQIAGFFLQDALAHQELKLVSVQQDNLRPVLHFKSVYQANHQPFKGYNRAQAAVIELAVLASRLHLLPLEKITTEMQYLQIAIDKTAGEHELQAWAWLCEKINNYRAQNPVLKATSINPT